MHSAKTISTQVVSPPTEQDSDETLWRTARAHLAKLDKLSDKANQHQVAIGLTLKTLKARHDQHSGTWAEWEALLKDQLSIGKSRASELMQIADGRKSVESSRAANAAANKRLRDRKTAPSRDGEPDATPSTETGAEATTITPGQRTFASPAEAHGRPIPVSEDAGAGVTLVPAADADAEATHERIHELEIEVEALKVENAELRRQLKVYQSPIRCDFVEDDGGREAAGYGGASGDCVARSITIATGKPYAEVFEALKAKHAHYVKNLRHDHYEKTARREPVHNGCTEKVSGPYLKSLGWKYTRIKERAYLRAGALPSGRLIVSLRGHYVALINGVIHDTYDSGKTCKQPVTGYWSQASEPNIEANIKRTDKVAA